jgi:hypothetical protein
MSSASWERTCGRRAALAGWDAGSARAAQQQDAASHLADHVATAVRAELAPVLARIERLEGMAAR